MLEIYAGKNARKVIEEQGFTPSLFTSVLGASGGPKWFTLYALDKYVFGEFFQDRVEPINLIGSSAGAFRMACFSQNDPVAAIERLANNYCHTTYSEKADAKEITVKARALLDIVMGQDGCDEIINNPVFKAHFVVAKCNGFVSSENKAVQVLGLAKSYIYNRVGRRHLASQYERYVFQPDDSELSFSDPVEIPTTHCALTNDNLKDSLLASGSIPMVMEGIRDIAGCDQGMYRDGGIVDYHFDIKINNPGLTLYPHFSSELKAGWFDKNLSRQVASSHYDNTVLICPSPEFIASLPYQKIPDRSDFTDLCADKRIEYWQQVFVQSEQLALAFKSFYESQDLTQVKPIESLYN